MTIDPRIGVWVSIVLAVLGVLVGAGAEFADLGLSPKAVKAVLAASTLLLAIGNAVNAVLHMIPAYKPENQVEEHKFALGPRT